MSRIEGRATSLPFWDVGLHSAEAPPDPPRPLTARCLPCRLDQLDANLISVGLAPLVLDPPYRLAVPTPVVSHDAPVAFSPLVCNRNAEGPQGPLGFVNRAG